MGLFGCLYFLPTIIGRRKRNVVAIFVLNLFLGWSGLGWIVALIWSCTVDRDSIR
ncbi:MAG: superinfection immunity protein [Acidobacteriota bacterium]